MGFERQTKKQQKQEKTSCGRHWLLAMNSQNFPEQKGNSKLMPDCFCNHKHQIKFWEHLGLPEIFD